MLLGRDPQHENACDERKFMYHGEGVQIRSTGVYGGRMACRGGSANRPQGFRHVIVGI